MKELLYIAVCLVFVLLVLLTGCQMAVAQATPQTTLTMEDLMQTCFNECYAIVVAECAGFSKHRLENYINSHLTILETIKGGPVDANILLHMIKDTHSDMAFPAMKEGTKYLLAISKINNHLKYAPTGYGHGIHGVYVELTPQDEIVQILSLRMPVEKEAIKCETLQDMKDYIAAKCDIKAPGIETGMPFTRSEKIEEVVAFSYGVYKGTVTSLDFERTDVDMAIYTFDIAENVSRQKTAQTIKVATRKNTLEIGKEYILLLSPDESEEKNYYAVSSTNALVSIIPIEDTERVNKVYELLGIKH